MVVVVLSFLFYQDVKLLCEDVIEALVDWHAELGRLLHTIGLLFEVVDLLLVARLRSLLA